MCERVLQDASKKYSACAEINALKPLGLTEPLKSGRHLRENFKNRRFARNRELTFTGRFQKSLFCP
ncbi:hypothetical protein GKD00_08420 [Lactobacillus ruminis]|jgi:hypothetical protein|nr:hypothetical protein [Ligilactobacillus ruminis]MSB54891.1 hypothetical protein [Ligilactobacillus ruminis]MSB56528.1 hypothetical protein [Ligilactobacillus ruminis]MSB81973.1 hypothetical protein [Ligilactobacillus ruminis]MSB91524.1 hypothetical protein [Ligilactobacillus ruminis]